MIKPFNVDELQARIRVALRVSKTTTEENNFKMVRLRLISMLKWFTLTTNQFI